jgi:transcriptional regulator with XRE-family HTH domain
VLFLLGSVCSVPSPLRLYQILGETIRDERLRAGFSQEKLAERANLTRNYIGQIERAEKRIHLETLAKIAKALNLRVNDLTRDI